jgi:hypothetical protein
MIIQAKPADKESPPANVVTTFRTKDNWSVINYSQKEFKYKK